MFRYRFFRYSADTGFSDIYIYIGFPDTGFSDTGFSDTGFSDTGFSDTGFSDTGFQIQVFQIKVFQIQVSQIQVFQIQGCKKTKKYKIQIYVCKFISTASKISK